MSMALMHLRILLPFEIFSDQKNVKRMVAETQDGLFGILPRRLDCVAALIPGILTFESETEGETFVAVDEGVLIKTGLDVRVAVRSAVSGTDLHKLQQHVEDEFVHLSEQQARLRSVLIKMESGFMRRLSEFRHE